jgi:hypothetical protein
MGKSTELEAGRSPPLQHTLPATGGNWKATDSGAFPRPLRGPLPCIEIQTDAAGRKGSFVRLSELLGSPLWPKPDSVTLGALWDSLPGGSLNHLGVEVPGTDAAEAEQARLAEAG